jgi:hypothetical protein
VDLVVPFLAALAALAAHPEAGYCPPLVSEGVYALLDFENRAAVRERSGAASRR